MYIYIYVQHINTYVYMFIYMVLLYYVCTVFTATRGNKRWKLGQKPDFSESGIFAHHLCAKKI